MSERRVGDVFEMVTVVEITCIDEREKHRERRWVMPSTRSLGDKYKQLRVEFEHGSHVSISPTECRGATSTHATISRNEIVEKSPRQIHWNCARALRSQDMRPRGRRCVMFAITLPSWDGHKISGVIFIVRLREIPKDVMESRQRVSLCK